MTETLHGATRAKVGTDIFITDKAGIRELPEDERREDGVRQRKENEQKLANRNATGVRIDAQRMPPSGNNKQSKANL